MNTCDIIVQNLEEQDWHQSLANYAVLVLEKIGLESWEISVTLCDDEYIRELNASFRGKDEPTDVLSFPLIDGDDDGGEAVSEDPHASGAKRESGAAFDPSSWDSEEVTGQVAGGDIVISLNTVLVNAEYFGVPAEEELRRVLVHGVLHLSGMDHATIEPDEPMLVLQEKILSEIKEIRFPV